MNTKRSKAERRRAADERRLLAAYRELVCRVQMMLTQAGRPGVPVGRYGEIEAALSIIRELDSVPFRLAELLLDDVPFDPAGLSTD